ncbi:recombinase family protein [Candidatus Woesearchaeota archaeon]|nr:recombinase family protein [Candidatus Woesearchaeota archaeon]
MKFKKNSEKTLYIYCRVSTSGQEQDGSSLEVQKERGIKLSKKLNLSPVVIQEQGSGMKPYLETRKKFTELMDCVEDGVVKNVWIDEDTRLTRLDTDQQYIHITMKKQDVNLFVGSSTIPKKWDWITDLVDTIITKVNQNQIRTQVRKSIRSKRKLFQEGCYMKGDPPFGYELIDKKLSLHPIHSDWVKKIFTWYDKGKSTWWIRNELFSNEIEPPRGKGKGVGFSFQTVVNILRNKNYIGIDVYGDLTNTCPVIIEKDVFDSVQKKLDSKQSRSVTPKDEFLLREVIKCPDGTSMSCLGTKKSRKNPLYSCKHRVRKYEKRRDSVENCTISRSLRVDVIDEYIWNQLIDILSQSHQIKEQTRSELIGGKSKYTKRSINGKIKKVQRKLLDLENNSLELDKKFYTNKMDKKKHEILSKTIDEEQQGLMIDLSSLEMKLDVFDRNNKWIDWLEVHFNRMDEIRKMDSFKQKKQTIEHYIHEINVMNYDEESKQHTLSIKFKFPLFDDQFDWLKNKDGSYKRDKLGRRIGKVTEGKTKMNNHLTLDYLLHRDAFRQIPWLIYMTSS